MKKRWIGVKIVLSVCAAFGWWGALYPQLTLTPDTYKIVEETAAEENALERFVREETLQESKEALEWDFESEIYWDLLNAGSGNIHFRSRLVQILMDRKGK